MSEKVLLPDRHPQTDIFICDIADAAIKDDMASMEHPIFVLSTKPCMKSKIYQNGENWLEVNPSHKGIATIWDKDILIFAISQIMAAKNANAPYSRHISFTAYDFLVFSNRNTGGKDYEALKDSLERLGGTRLVTNIVTGDEEQVDGFGLIDKFRIRKKRLDGQVVEWGITLSDWLFNAIDSNEVLTISPEYFRLRKPLERRVYEIARKHCGSKKEWRIGIDLLMKKCGSTSPKRNFKAMLKKISEHDHLPDYDVAIINDTILFSKKSTAKNVQLDLLNHPIPQLRTSTYDKFRKSHPGYDPYYVEHEWRVWAAGKEPPINADAAFLAFSKSYVKRHPN